MKSAGYLIAKILVLSIYMLFIAGLGTVVVSIIKGIKQKRYKGAAIKGSIILAICLALGFTVYASSRKLPGASKYASQYIMSLNEVKKSSSGTSVTLDEVLMDINNISFSMGVKGKDKLVAVEVKKSLEDKEPLGVCKNMWLGKNVTYEYNGLGMNYKGDAFLDKLYLIAYLSNGEELNFEVKDQFNVKDKVKVMKLSRDIKTEKGDIRLRSFTRGLSYSSIYMVSDVDFFNLEVTFIDGNGKEYKNLSGGGSGGQYSLGANDYLTGNITVKIKVKGTGKGYNIPVKLD